MTRGGGRASVIGSTTGCLRVVAWLIALALARNPAPVDASPAGGGEPGANLQRVDLGIVAYPDIDEASGIVASRRNPGIFWVHNDGRDGDRIYALNRRAELVATFAAPACRGRDREDIAIGPGPSEGSDYLYVGAIGDNGGGRDTVSVCRFPEPRVGAGEPGAARVIEEVETLSFSYPDGPRDAETLLLDPITRDLYLVSKREPRVGVYRAAYPQATDAVNLLERVASLDLSLVTAGDVSPRGDRILLRTYWSVLLWNRPAGEPLWRAFSNRPERLPYRPEVQGEAICWDPAETGYYTLSEARLGFPAHLYFYPHE